MKKIETISAYLTKIDTLFNFLIEKINSWPTILMLSILFAGNFLTFIPDGNEENYLQLSKQFINPHWIENSFSLNEFAGTRLVYQYICGFTLQYISFEMLTFLGRLFIVLWFSASIAALLRKTTLTNIYSLFLFQALFFFKQSVFGGENLFLGFEPKHIAYGFILLALSNILEKKYLITTICILLASWFHILVGLWFFLAYIIFILLDKEVTFKQVVINCLVYGILLSPFIYFLANEIILHSTKVIHSVSADWIYTVFRNPHHTAIFSSLDYFYDNHAIGVLCCLIIAICSIVFFPKYASGKLGLMNRFVAVISCILLFNVVLAFFDKEGHFVKYYPFRLASIQLLLFYIIAFSMIKEYFIKQHLFVSIAFVIIVLFFTMFCTLNIFKMIRFGKNRNNAFYEMATYIKSQTAKEAVIYYSEKAENFTLSFTREATRDRFVIYKFVPAGTNKIYEWYDRILFQEQVDKNSTAIFEAKKKYKIDYMLTTDSIPLTKLNLIKSIPPYLLYQL
jgi:hypothetical protein